MAFDQSRFWQAFKSAGMLDEAWYRPATGDAYGVDVGFVQPDVPILNDLVQTTEYVIEYQTADMPALKIGERLTIKTVEYKVRANPQKKGDGYYSVAELTKL